MLIVAGEGSCIAMIEIGSSDLTGYFIATFINRLRADMTDYWNIVSAIDLDNEILRRTLSAIIIGGSHWNDQGFMLTNCEVIEARIGGIECVAAIGM